MFYLNNQDLVSQRWRFFCLLSPNLKVPGGILHFELQFERKTAEFICLQVKL